jgi:hypothetical protein
MAILPDNILTDQKINEFIDQVNFNATRIVGDSKFVIPPSDLPGTGLLIKIWIRQAEKSFSSYLVPVLAIRDSLNNPSEIPGKIRGISNFINDPVQTLLDESINNQINQNFFLPLRLTLTSRPSADFSRLQALVNRADAESVSPLPSSPKFPFVLGAISSPPSNGEYTVNSLDPEKISIISLNKNDYNGFSLDSSFLSLVPGDTLTIGQDGISNSWIIKSISSFPNYYSFFVSLLGPPSPTLEPEKTIYVQSLPNAEGGALKSLKSLILGPNGTIKFPIIIGSTDILKLAGIQVPLQPLDLIKVEIGNFDSLPGDSPTKKKIKDLEVKSGWNFQDILNKVLEGKYPVLDYDLNSQKETSKNKEKKDRLKAREEILSLIKLVTMVAEAPSDFFRILGGYLKLLLFPFQIVFETLSKIFMEVLENPLRIYGLIVQLITDPIKTLGDFISESVLNIIRPYIEPSLASANTKWEEIEEIKDSGKIKGLKPLISDLIIGRFKCADVGSSSTDSIFSCLVENYLPPKAVAIWETVKGILGVVLGFVSTIPFLIRSIFESIFSLDSFKNPLSSLVGSLVEDDAYPLETIFNSEDSQSVLEILNSYTDRNGIDFIFDRTSKETSLKEISASLVSDRKTKRDLGIEKISTVDLGKRIKVLASLAKTVSTTKDTKGEIIVNFPSRILSVDDQSVKVDFFDGTTLNVRLSEVNNFRITKSEIPDLKKLTGEEYILEIKNQLQITLQLLKSQIVF